MKTWIEALICFLKMLQKFPYEDILADLDKFSIKPAKSQSDRLQIHFKDEAIFINNIKIIDKKSERLSQVFLILFDKFIDDYKSGIKAENFALINVKQIAKLLEKTNPIRLDPEKQVRWHINTNLGRGAGSDMPDLRSKSGKEGRYLQPEAS